MEITTTSRRFKLSPEVKDHAEKRIAKLSKYFDNILEAHLVLAQEKYRHLGELTVHATGVDLVSKGEDTDILTTIDKVVDRMERQIKKYSARLKRRVAAQRIVPAGEVVDEAQLGDVEPEEEYSPVVVRADQCAAEPMTVEDAIRFMDGQGWDLLLFSNARSGRQAVLHHRDDGNYGLIEQEN